MKFEELTTQHQDFLMYYLFDHIKRKVKEEERDQVIEPTYEEYKAFFDEFDGENEKRCLSLNILTYEGNEIERSCSPFLFLRLYL